MYTEALLFLTGSCLYPALEMAWRGRTHSSMALAGGLCLCLIDRVCCSRLKDRDMLSRCTAGAVPVGADFRVADVGAVGHQISPPLVSCCLIWSTPVAANPLTMPTAAAVTGSAAGSTSRPVK